VSAAAERRTHRRHAASVLRARRAETRARTRPVKVSDFLTSVGADPEFIDKYGSTAGKYIAKEYRAAHYGHDPRTTRRRTKPCKGYPEGRWIKVFCYRATDPALVAGAREYKRTAPYVAEYTSAA
jgi:hypothetical protein